jgi:5-formyltetrahydrofolate cyclo-ligase
MPTCEVDTTSLATSILRAGKKLFVPKIDYTKDRDMDFLRIYSEEDLESLPRGKWDIREPGYEWQGQKRQSALEEGLDLILLPGLAFDRALCRLGHGKGYYDHFISTFSERRERPQLVALALREQVLAAGEVPTGAFDWSMDSIITPDEIITSVP